MAVLLCGIFVGLIGGIFTALKDGIFVEYYKGIIILVASSIICRTIFMSLFRSSRNNYGSINTEGIHTQAYRKRVNRISCDIRSC